MFADVKNYRRIKGAVLDGGPVIHVGADNEGGKTSLSEALRAGLTQDALVSYITTKKEAGLLVHNGERGGSVRISRNADDTENASGIDWPSCAPVVRGIGPRSCAVVAGGLHPFDEAIKVRALSFDTTLNAKPSKEDIRAKLIEIGHSEEQAESMAVSLSKPDADWAKALASTVEAGARLKNEWSMATQINYGDKVFADWMEKAMATTPPDLASLELATGNAQAARDAALKVGAVAAAELERHQVNANRLEETEASLARANADLLKAQDMLAAAEKKAGSLPRMMTQEYRTPCECNLPVVLTDDPQSPGRKKLVLSASTGFTDIQRREAQEAAAAADATLGQARSEITTINARITNLTRDLADIKNSIEFVENAEAGGGDAVDLEVVEKALADAKAAERAASGVIEGMKVGAKLNRNQMLIAELKPEGMRRRAMETALNEVNAYMAELAQVAKFKASPVINIDMTVTVGPYPYEALSKGAQLKARILFIFAVQARNSDAIAVIDEFDLLKKAAKGGFFRVFQHHCKPGREAVVLGSYNAPEEMPDFAKLGVGRSYFITDGIAKAIS